MIQSAETGRATPATPAGGPAPQGTAARAQAGRPGYAGRRCRDACPYDKLAYRRRESQTGADNRFLESSVDMRGCGIDISECPGQWCPCGLSACSCTLDTGQAASSVSSSQGDELFIIL